MLDAINLTVVVGSILSPNHQILMFSELPTRVNNVSHVKMMKAIQMKSKAHFLQLARYFNSPMAMGTPNTPKLNQRVPVPRRVITS